MSSPEHIRDRLDGWMGQRGRSLDPNGGGPHDGGMEARVAKLESDVCQIQSDISDIKTDIREHRQGLVSFSKDVKDEFKLVRDEMKADFRILFGALIFVAIGLAGLMAKGFGWIGS